MCVSCVFVSLYVCLCVLSLSSPYDEVQQRRLLLLRRRRGPRLGRLDPSVEHKQTLIHCTYMCVYVYVCVSLSRCVCM